MRAELNAAPVVIRKKKKKVSGEGHHGGAWKVAYADFVTAMMAFFMLMWLLNATTEKQRKGIADYFSPTIPVMRQSGGGDGALGGDSVFSERELARSGTGAAALHPAEDLAARGADPSEQDDQALRQLEEALTARTGESLDDDALMRHVVTRVTDEGLVVELIELEDARLFDEADRPTDMLRALAAMIARLSVMVANPVAVEAHVSARPVVLARNPVWDQSSGRAQSMRELLERGGLEPERIRRVTGHADRAPASPDPMAVGNNRLEVIFLRRV
jgi:chemotaxis protein MotB